MSKNRIDKVILRHAEKVRSKEIMQEVADLMKEMVVKRTRLGSGSDGPGGNKTKLNPLSPAYIAQRKRMKEELSPLTTPSRSNLTRTGHMLDSVVTEVDEGVASLTFSDEHAGDKAKWVSKDRPFFYLTKTELDRVLRFLRNKIREIIGGGA